MTQKRRKPGLDKKAEDLWFTPPQAIYLEATRDFETALTLTHHDPQVLTVDVMRRLAQVNIPATKALARHEAREAVLKALASKRGKYHEAVRGLQDKLVRGLAAKGRRGA